MASFRYRAYTTQGVVTTGTIVADRLEAAIDALYSSGLTPFETTLSGGGGERTPTAREAATPIWRWELGKSDRYSLKELAAFSLELATLVNAGLSVDASFRIMAGPGATPKRVRLANGLLKDVLGGSQLSEAMLRRRDIFPPDYLAILAAGEAAGKIGEVLNQIATMLAKRVEIRAKILAALVYPAILILMSLASIAVIVFVLVPNLAPIFVDAGLPLPGILGSLAALPDNWMILSIGALGAGGVGVALWRAVKGNATILLEVDRLKCRVPMLGRLLQIREAGLFARSLGTLLDARVPLMPAMQTARALITNRHLNARYADAIGKIPEGAALSRAFAETNLLPSAALQLIAVGEESGQLARMLLQIADTLETDLQRQIEQLVNLLTPVLTLAIGGGVGALIMQVMSSVLSINNLAFQ